MSNNETVTTLERLANLLRIHSIESTQASNSGLDDLFFINDEYFTLFFLCIIVIQQVAHQWLKLPVFCSSMLCDMIQKIHEIRLLIDLFYQK